MNAPANKIRDEWLALRCQHGEPEAFRDLVRQMERPLLYFARKLLNDEDKALDVLQEVWLKAFRSIRRLEQPRQLRAWLYQMTRSLVVDRIRKEKADERAERAYAEDANTTPEPTFDAEVVASVHQALDSLDWPHREVLVLYFLENMTAGEIASVVGCPEGTVKSRIHYAKRALKAVLREKVHGES